MKTTKYFESIQTRPDRTFIKIEWIQYVIEQAEKELIQNDGRIRKWAKITEYNDKYLRVVLLEDGETVHNAFFDRNFKP